MTDVVDSFLMIIKKEKTDENKLRDMFAFSAIYFVMRGIRPGIIFTVNKSLIFCCLCLAGGGVELNLSGGSLAPAWVGAAPWLCCDDEVGN